jgi:hypothetical protein
MKGEKCVEVVRRKLSGHLTPPAVMPDGGKPSPVQEQIHC